MDKKDIERRLEAAEKQNLGLLDEIKNLKAKLAEVKIVNGKNTDLKFQVYPVQPKPYKIEIDPVTQALIDYNNELRRMLKLAVDDLDTAVRSCEQDMLCEICSYHEKCDYINYCGGEYDRTWKHRDEAMKLLGGADNA